jgi:hypothetical protein
MENKKSTMDLNFEKRNFSRKSSNSHNTAVICNGASYSAVIENICDNGMHVIATSKKCVPSFVPETILEMKTKSSREKEIKLHGEVRWVHINRTPIHGLTYRMGVELMKVTHEYEKYVSMQK